MSRLIAQVIRWIVRKLGLLIVIVAILGGARPCCSRNGASTARSGRRSGSRRRTSSPRSSASWMRSTPTSRRSQTQAQASRGQYLDLAKQSQAARRAAQRARARLEILENATTGGGTTTSAPPSSSSSRPRGRTTPRSTAPPGWPKPRGPASPRPSPHLRKQVDQLELRRAEHVARSDAFERRLEMQRAEVEQNPREQMIATVKSPHPARTRHPRRASC